MTKPSAGITVELDTKEAEQHAKSFGEQLTHTFEHMATQMIPVVDIGALVEKGLEKIGEAAAEVAEKLFEFAKETIHAAAEEEKAQHKLIAALKLRGDAQAEVLEHIEKTNLATQFETGISKEALLALESRLTLLGVQKDKLDEAARAAIGLSEATGKGLEASGTTIAKVLSGNLGALKRLGIEAKTSDEALEMLSTRFAVASERTETFGGKVDRLHAFWEEFLASLGKTITESEAVKGVLDELTLIVIGLAHGVDAVRPTIVDFFDLMIRKAHTLAVTIGRVGAAAAAAVSAIPLVGVVAAPFVNAGALAAAGAAEGLGAVGRHAIAGTKEERSLMEEAAAGGSGFAGTGGRKLTFDPQADAAARAQAARDAKEMHPNREDFLKELQEQADREMAIRRASTELVAEFEHDKATEEHRRMQEHLIQQREEVDARNALLFEAGRREIITLEDIQRERLRVQLSQVLSEETKQHKLQVLQQKEQQLQGSYAGIARAGAMTLGGMFAEATTAAIANGENFGEVFKRVVGSQLISLGASLVAAGVAAEALTLLSFIPIFGISLGFPGAVAIAGAAAIAGGTGLIAAGAAMGGAGGHASHGGGAGSPRGGGRSGGTDQTNAPRGFDPSSVFNDNNAPATVVFNINGGIFGGSKKQMGRDLADVLAEAGALRLGGR